MSSPEAWKTWEGRVVDGKYRLRQWLGGSDHSAVFLTERYGQPGQKAAIKLIATTAGDAHPQLLRWRTAAQLSHPHLIRIYETGRCQMDGVPHLYLAMEFAEEDLSQILPQRPLAPAEVTDLLPPLLDALSYLHGQKLVHRRIKPSNVLAVGDLLKLSSDQIAAPAEAGTGKRRDVYDAPETATGIASSAGDLWSVGATLVEALTQNAPLVDETFQRDPDVPADILEPFRGIARECLHLDPKRRCSIAEIKARMQPAARSVPAEPEAPPPPRSTIPRGRLVAALLAAVALIGLVVFFSRGKSVPAPTSTTTEQSAPQAVPQITPQAARAPAAKPPAHVPVEPPKKASASRGEIIRQVLPDIPQSAKNTITGTIKIGVRVEVDSSGKVTTAKLAPAGPSKYFANLTLRAAQQWEFSPPDANGQPTASAWLLQFHLKRTSIQVVPERLKR